MAERRRVIVLGLVAVVVLVAVRGASFLTDHREVIASTPTPMALGPGTPVQLPPGSQACMDNVTLGPDSQVARFGIADTFGRPGPPLVVSAASGGYHLHAPIAGGYAGGKPLDVPIRPPGHTLITTLCVRDTGGGKVALAGTTEGRTVSRSYTTVDGQLQVAHVSLTLQRRARQALLPRIPELLGRVAALNPTSPAIVWLLALATLVLVPVGAFWALAAGLAAGTAPVPDARATAPPLPLARRVRRARRALAPAYAKVAALPAWVWLALLLVLSAGWLFLWGTRNHAFEPDEGQYVYLARWVDTALPGSLWNFTFIPTGFQRLEIWLLAPIVGLLPGPTWATVGHGLNATLWALAAVPVYLIVRGLGLRGRWAVLAGFLTAVVPWAVVSVSFLTEPSAYPAFAAAIWAIWRATARPGWRRDAAAIVLIVIAGLARVNLLALGALLPFAVVLQELRFGQWRKARGLSARAAAFGKALLRGHPLLVGVVLVGLAAVVLNSTGGLPLLNKVTGFYGITNRFNVPLSLFKAKLDLYTARFVAGIAFVPFAFGLAWMITTVVRPRDPARFAFAVVALGAVAVVIYTSAGAGADERYLIYYAPLFTAAFAVALGGREVRPIAVGLAGVVGALLLLHQTWALQRYGPFSWFAAPAETTYADGILARLQNDVPGGIDVRAVAFVLELGIAALCALAVSRRRWSGRLAAGLVAAVVLVQVGHTASALSKHVNGAGERFGASPAQRAWVDKVLYGKSHASIFATALSNSPAWNDIWSELQFWNDSVTSVATLGPRGINVPTSDTWTQVGISPNGRLTGSPLGPYLVVTRWLDVGLDAQPAAQSPYLPLDLVRLRSRNVRWTAAGAQPDGYMTPRQQVQIGVYPAAIPGQGPACVDVDVTAPSGYNGLRRVTLAAGGVSRSGQVGQAKAIRVELPLLHPGRAYTELTLTAAGSTQLPDGRQASVQISHIGARRCSPRKTP